MKTFSLFNHQNQYGPSPLAVSYMVWSVNVTRKMHSRERWKRPAAHHHQQLTRKHPCVMCVPIKWGGKRMDDVELFPPLRQWEDDDGFLSTSRSSLERFFVIVIRESSFFSTTTGCHKARIPFPLVSLL